MSVRRRKIGELLHIIFTHRRKKRGVSGKHMDSLYTKNSSPTKPMSHSGTTGGNSVSVVRRSMNPERSSLTIILTGTSC